jgi:hypothetical protein
MFDLLHQALHACHIHLQASCSDVVHYLTPKREVMVDGILGHARQMQTMWHMAEILWLTENVIISTTMPVPIQPVP